jgi:hypothetical protein
VHSTRRKSMNKERFDRGLTKRREGFREVGI